MALPLTNITIVGGGTAGWLAAAYLNHRLQWGMTKRPGVTVTVIESPGIGTIGVGEATLPTLNTTLKMLEISEAEFIKRTNATFKLGILFNRWQAASDDGSESRYIHPFTDQFPVYGHNAGSAFLRHGLPGRPHATVGDFIAATSPVDQAMRKSKGPRAIGSEAFDGPLRYAYHLDAGLLAEFLKEMCVSRGVVHVADDVVSATKDERGFISSLTLKNGGDHPTELVIDCTGFKGLLINQVMEEPFESFSDYLLNDRAVPTPIQRKVPSDIYPATIATAMDAGWSWRIPLHSRDGSGYVFSSHFKSDDEAIDEFLTFIGDEKRLADPRVIKMRVGRCRRSWVKNCVAIGLSSGFLEPLESTAIWTIEMACRLLLEFLPSSDFEEPLSRQFNLAMERAYDETRDFIGLHFSQSNRTDTPYWLAVRHEARRSDLINECLQIWRHALPSEADPRRHVLFSPASVQYILMGKGFYQGAQLAGGSMVPEQVWYAHVNRLRRENQEILERLPDHYALLEAIRADAVDGESSAPRPVLGDAAIPDAVLTNFARLMAPMRS